MKVLIISRLNREIFLEFPVAQDSRQEVFIYMTSSHKLSSLNQLANSLKVILYAIAIFLIPGQSIFAQQNFRTPVIDGVINAQQLEYGNNEEDHDRRTSGPVTWWITWDADNFYIATSGAPVAEGAVCYFDRNPITPTNGGTNIDGNLAGLNFDGARYGTLPFRADFVAYFSTVKREWHTASSGAWTPPLLGGGTFASVGGQREYGIPWNAISNGNGRLTAFLFFCYGVNSAGSVYGQVPAQNPGGAIGNNATATYFYRIYDSIDPVNKPPFSQVNSSTPPTAATGTVSGAITSKSGRAISRAQVMLVGDDGRMRTAFTNPFGNYVFTDVPFGGFYIIQVGMGKGNSASDARTFTFSEDINDMNFVLQ
jgi:hypothetical protein